MSLTADPTRIPYELRPELEREAVRLADIEQRMALLAEQGTWVWGCWLRPAEVKPRSFGSNVGMVRQ